VEKKSGQDLEWGREKSDGSIVRSRSGVEGAGKERRSTFLVCGVPVRVNSGKDSSERKNKKTKTHHGEKKRRIGVGGHLVIPKGQKKNC